MKNKNSQVEVAEEIILPANLQTPEQYHRLISMDFSIRISENKVIPTKDADEIIEDAQKIYEYLNKK